MTKASAEGAMSDHVSMNRPIKSSKKTRCHLKDVKQYTEDGFADQVSFVLTTQNLD